MTNTFYYHQAVPIEFGLNKLAELPTIIGQHNFQKGLLITTKSMLQNEIVNRILEENKATINEFFYDIQPNPTIQNTDDCIATLKQGEYDFVVALGGGSVLDCAKVASALAPTNFTTQAYFDGDITLSKKGLPLIAIPTTAGTASEITKVSVLTDPHSGKKAPLNSPYLYPVHALVDPLLTVSCSKEVTASSGIDVLAHAIEALYNKNHQPFTDLFAEHAVSLVFEYLQVAYEEPNNLEAREKMAEASLAAGLAFNITQTAAAHACSYPLTEQLNIPHGEACAFTLSKFWLLNSSDPAYKVRLQKISTRLGFENAAELAERIEILKSSIGLRLTWEQLGVTTDAQLQDIINASFAPNILNNPVVITKENLYSLYKTLSK